MATIKTVTVLDNNYTLVAGAANHDSSVADLTDGYFAGLVIKMTNLATGPTLQAQAQIRVSLDGTNYYDFAGAISPGTVALAEISRAVTLPIWAKYAKVVSGSNTGQNVTIRVECGEVSDVNA